MDSKDLLLDSLDKRGAAYSEKLKLCRAELSKRGVHDLRTSIRRLLATLDVVAFVASGSRVEKLSERLKEQLDSFNNLRDVQMMLDQIDENINTLPELGLFQKDMEKREKKKQRVAEKNIQNIKPGYINQRLLKMYDSIHELSAEELRCKLPQAVDEAYLTVMQRYGEIDPEQLISIHHLRVAFKRFRYMVEAIQPCLPDFPETQLQRMHDYQTQMGRIHDIQVFLETLEKFSERNDSYDPEPVRRSYEHFLADALSEYLKNKGDVFNFWRSTPLVTFPWQREQIKKEE